MAKYYCVANIGREIGAFIGNTDSLTLEELEKWRRELAENNDVKLSSVLITNITKLDE